MSEPQNPTPEEPAGSAAPPPPPPPPPPPAGTNAPPAYAPQPAASTAGQPGDLLMRFLARLIDGILLAIVSGIIVTAIIVGAIMGESGAYGFGPGDNIGAALVASLFSVAINLGYFVFMESSRGQTVGKMLLKLETRGPGGGHPTVEEAVKRNIFIAIGLLSWIPILGILAGLAQLVAYIMVAVTINSSATKQGWHDKFAGGTQVVKTA